MSDYVECEAEDLDTPVEEEVLAAAGEQRPVQREGPVQEASDPLEGVCSMISRSYQYQSITQYLLTVIFMFICLCDLQLIYLAADHLINLPNCYLLTTFPDVYFSDIVNLFPILDAYFVTGCLSRC